MQNNLIKSILGENILSFKEESNTLLYSKLNSKLKQKYIGISKSLFGSINESSALPPPDLFGEPVMFEIPGTGFKVPIPTFGGDPSDYPVVTAPNPWPKPPYYTPGPDYNPNPEDYFPEPFGEDRPPQREDYPPGEAGNRMYEEAYKKWKEAMKRLNSDRAKQQAWDIRFAREQEWRQRIEDRRNRQAWDYYYERLRRFIDRGGTPGRGDPAEPQEPRLPNGETRPKPPGYEIPPQFRYGRDEL